MTICSTVLRSTGEFGELITYKVFINIYSYFQCYTVHVVELLNYYTNHCTYIKFIKYYTLKH